MNSSNIEVKFTNNADRHLDELVEGYRNKIVRSIVESRAAPGDRVVEITPSDVADAEKRFVFFNENLRDRRQRLIFTLAAFYAAFGAVIVLYSLTSRLLTDGMPSQSILLLMGMVMIFTGVCISTLNLLTRAFRRPSQQSIDYKLSLLSSEPPSNRSVHFPSPAKIEAELRAIRLTIDELQQKTRQLEDDAE